MAGELVPAASRASRRDGLWRDVLLSWWLWGAALVVTQVLGSR